MSGNEDRRLWALVGLAAGAAVGIWLWTRRRGGEPTAVGGETDAALRVARAYDNDIELAARGLGVTRISEGVIEVTGVVADRDQRQRAVAMAHNTPGVHTVVNRLVLEDEERRVAESRARNRDRPIRHTGMGVGMGTRRQSPDTDPDRPSDRQKLVDRELDVPKLEQDLGPAGPDEPET